MKKKLLLSLFVASSSLFIACGGSKSKKNNVETKSESIIESSIESSSEIESSDSNSSLESNVIESSVESESEKTSETESIESSLESSSLETFTIQYTVNDKTSTLEHNRGEVVDDLPKDLDYFIKNELLVKTYSFKGWMDNETGLLISEKIIANKDYDLKAVFEENVDFNYETEELTDVSNYRLELVDLLDKYYEDNNVNNSIKSIVGVGLDQGKLFCDTFIKNDVEFEASESNTSFKTDLDLNLTNYNISTIKTEIRQNSNAKIFYSAVDGFEVIIDADVAFYYRKYNKYGNLENSITAYKIFYDKDTDSYDEKGVITYNLSYSYELEIDKDELLNKFNTPNDYSGCIIGNEFYIDDNETIYMYFDQYDVANNDDLVDLKAGIYSFFDSFDSDTKYYKGNDYYLISNNENFIVADFDGKILQFKNGNKLNYVSYFKDFIQSNNEKNSASLEDLLIKLINANTMSSYKIKYNIDGSNVYEYELYNIDNKVYSTNSAYTLYEQNQIIGNGFEGIKKHILKNNTNIDSIECYKDRYGNYYLEYYDIIYENKKYKYVFDSNGNIRSLMVQTDDDCSEYIIEPMETKYGKITIHDDIKGDRELFLPLGSKITLDDTDYHDENSNKDYKFLGYLSYPDKKTIEIDKLNDEIFDIYCNYDEIVPVTLHVVLRNGETINKEVNKYSTITKNLVLEPGKNFNSYDDYYPGFGLSNWYKDKDLKQPFTFGSEITSELYIYASYYPKTYISFRISGTESNRYYFTTQTANTLTESNLGCIEYSGDINVLNHGNNEITTVFAAGTILKFDLRQGANIVYATHTGAPSNNIYLIREIGFPSESYVTSEIQTGNIFKLVDGKFQKAESFEKDTYYYHVEAKGNDILEATVDTNNTYYIYQESYCYFEYLEITDNNNLLILKN